MATMDAGANRPFKYGGKIAFDIPGVNAPAEADFVSGGANRGSAPFGDYPISNFVPHTPHGLQGFALNDAGGNMPDPKYPNAPRSDIMLHLDPRGRTLDKLRSSGCLSVPADEWPALRDQIVSLQKQGYKLVAHLDASGQVAIRTADSTAASPVSSTNDFIAYTNQTRQPTRDLQTTLAKAGFNPGKIDGINGPNTDAAIKAFQQANGLKPDGIVGPQTGAVLAAYGSGPKSPAPASNTTFGGRLPADAMNGVDRLAPGQKTSEPTFQGLFAHGAPADARTLSLTAPIRSLGATGSVGTGASARGSAAIVPGRPTALRALGASSDNGQTLGDIHDARDTAVIAAQHATTPPLKLPDATYTPPANANTAPAPQKQGLFQSLGGAIGSGLTSLGNSANDAAKYLGNGVRDTVAAIPEKAQQAADYLTPLVLGNLEARSAFLDPMIGRIGSPTAGDHSPTRYGATFQDRQQAAQNRERLSQGLPPQQRQSQPQQAPTISTTFRSSSPAPKAGPAPANSNSGGGGNSGGAQTITGSATGRTYTVGQIYSNKDGQFRATPSGFKKVG